MSEVTYKKIVDVEQIDTLGEGTTLFVNDGGSMKQMGAAALGAVKSVNGVLPDENGEVTFDKAYPILITHLIFPTFDDIKCNKTGEEIHHGLLSQTDCATSIALARYTAATRHEEYRYCTNFELIKDGAGKFQKKYMIYFGDDISPYIVDVDANTITLDPDWVAPEADPEPTGAHQMLVTDAEGKQLWEERTHYSEYLTLPLVDETIQKQQLFPGFYIYSTSYLPDYPLELGAKCIVEIHGVQYECEVLEYGEGGVHCLGNRHLQAASAFEDTGEPFFFNTMFPGSMVTAYFSSSIEAPDTVKITGPVKVYKQIPSEYVAGLHEGEGRGSVVFGGGNTATGSAAFVEGAGNAAGGYAAHAEGCYTIADGSFSHAEGEGTIANGYAQHVDGKYNIEDSNNQYIHIAGNGVVDRGVATRSNAHTLDWSGNAWYQGNVYVGGTSQADGSKLVTESDVNTLIDSKLSELAAQEVSLPKSAGVVNHGTAGQFAVSDGMGGIMWKTLVEAEGVSY